MTENPDVLYNKGTDAYHKKNYEKASKLLKKSIAIHPTKEAYLNLGACYKQLGDLKRALKQFEEAARIDKNYPLAYNNIGLIYHMWNKEDIAYENFSKALELEPNYADAGWNKALSDLKRAHTGEDDKFAPGWHGYEWRFHKSGAVNLSRTNSPRWQKEKGGRVLVMNEQGIGDIIMFMRYLPYLKQDTDLIVQVPDKLYPFFMEYEVTNVSSVPHDYHIPFCSFPLYYNFIPSSPYFNVIADKVLDGGIGVVWKGNPDHGNDRNRSTYEANFKFLKEFGEVYSLQYGEKSKYFKNLEIRDWSDTIKYINSLDTIVTIDSSVAHLAGAMGKKVYIMLPGIDTDFRWGLQGTKSLWYSTAHLIRNMNFEELKQCMKLQKPQSEDSVMEISSNTLAVEV